MNARGRLEILQAETARARAGLTVCRTALETVEVLQRQRLQAAREERARRWQAELEGAGRQSEEATPPDGSGGGPDEASP